MPLFPIFAQRIMNPRRPDYSGYLETLGLPDNAVPLDILDRIGGYRKADTIRTFEEPRVSATGETAHRFFVQGVRFAQDELGLAVVDTKELRAGDRLSITPDLSNTVNPAALQAHDASGSRIGWIPDLLLDYVRALLDVAPTHLEVIRVNGPNVPPYLRVLVQVSGRVSTGFRPFGAPQTAGGVDQSES